MKLIGPESSIPSFKVPSFSVLEKKIFKEFLPYLKKFLYPKSQEAENEIPMGLLASEGKMFENADERWTEDGFLTIL